MSVKTSFRFCKESNIAWMCLTGYLSARDVDGYVSLRDNPKVLVPDIIQMCKNISDANF